MGTLTLDQQQALTDFLRDVRLARGLGTREAPCSLAAINLVLRGKLSDITPDCMSAVIGRWIRVTQDAMPPRMRNTKRWKAALVRAAGTGRQSDDEMRRLDMILTWLWETALPLVQPVADAHGFGEEWLRMCFTRAEADAKAAARAALATEWAATTATTTARATTTAVARAAETARATTTAAVVAGGGEWAAAAGWAAYAARTAARAVSAAGSDWQQLDPAGLLEQLAS